MVSTTNLLEQHGITLALKKEQMHKLIDVSPHFEILFSEITIGDMPFLEVFNDCLNDIGASLTNWKFHNRPLKMLNLASYFAHTVRSDVKGGWGECGVYMGLSTLFLCRVAQSIDPDFLGENFHAFDSFEGVSPPTFEDKIVTVNPQSGQLESSCSANTFAAPLQIVAKNLATRFPKIMIHEGWIPEVFQPLPEKQWAFIHIDVDQYQPTYDCLAYFYPRMSTGGVIVSDDYGAPTYPGAMKAWNQYCDENQIHFAILDSGQAVLVKK